jgi:hypothetical protein
MYYEGLEGFSQDLPCTIKLENDVLTITNQTTTAKLSIDQITTIDTLAEENFLVKYHNTSGTTAKMGTKFYYVIKYNSSNGEPKYIAFWDVRSKTMNYFLKLRAKIKPSEYNL